MCLVMVDALCYGLSDGNEEKGSLETLLKLTGINLVEDHIGLHNSSDISRQSEHGQIVTHKNNNKNKRSWRSCRSGPERASATKPKNNSIKVN